MIEKSGHYQESRELGEEPVTGSTVGELPHAEGDSSGPKPANPKQPGASKPSADVGRSWRGITDLADPIYLRRVWNREIRKHLGDLKFSSHNLVVDPLQGAVVARNLDDFIGQLSRDLKAGQYSPRRGIVLRFAKSLGISRPVCVLQPRDALVYRALVGLAEQELLRGVPAWVAFQRSDKATRGMEEEDDSESVDWFERWLRHEGMLPNLLVRDDINFVVQSDVSNFFPSVRLEVVREHLANNTSLDRTLVRLCCQIIASVHPRVGYADDSFLGLPQEANNSSRVIAQAILKPVDDEFEDMGLDGRYSRFMDDVLWGVASEQEAHHVLAKFQRRLEEIGLYPNGSKTRVRPKAEFLAAYMVESNATLEAIDRRAESLFDRGRVRKNPPPELVHDLQQAAALHRAHIERPDRWARVTRRIYSLQRRLGVHDWLEHWAEDLAQDPSGAATYFEYLRAWPIDRSILSTVGAAVDQFFGLYADIEVMFAETVATAPVAYSASEWSSIFDFASARFANAAKPARSDANIASAWFVAAAKYGNRQQRASLVGNGVKWCSNTMPGVVVQCAALDASLDLSKAIPPAQYGADEVLAADFLERLSNSDRQTLGVVRNQLTAVRALGPVRAIVRPRSLQLLDRIGALGELPARQVESSLRELRSNVDRLRDHRTEYLLEEWTDRV